MRRFTRLTNAFSKKLENLTAALSLLHVLQLRLADFPHQASRHDHLTHQRRHHRPGRRRPQPQLIPGLVVCGVRLLAAPAQATARRKAGPGHDDCRVTTNVGYTACCTGLGPARVRGLARRAAREADRLVIPSCANALRADDFAVARERGRTRVPRSCARRAICYCSLVRVLHDRPRPHDQTGWVGGGSGNVRPGGEA